MLNQRKDHPKRPESTQGCPCTPLFTSNKSSFFSWLAWIWLGIYFQNIGSRNISIYKQPLVLTSKGLLTLKTLSYPYPYPWKTLTLGEGWGSWRVRVKVRMKIPKGYPCPSLLTAWDQLDVADVDKYIHSMPDRVAAIFQAKGGHTHF